MASNAMRTQGSQLKRGDSGSPEVFTAIPEIRSFDGPGGTANDIDVTSLDSTAKEFLVGLLNLGNLTFEANYVPTSSQQIGLRNDQVSGVLRNYKLIFTDAGPSTFTFAARVKEFKTSAGVDDAVRLNVTLLISGAGTWS